MIFATIGISGSGKTTAIKSFYESFVGLKTYICPDDIREELCGDASDQSKNKEVFDLAYQKLRRALGQYSHVFWDATNYNQQNRRNLITIANCYDTEVVWIFLPVDLKTALERNAKRKRIVPVEVISRQFESLTLPGNNVLTLG